MFFNIVVQEGIYTLEAYKINVLNLKSLHKLRFLK